MPRYGIKKSILQVTDAVIMHNWWSIIMMILGSDKTCVYATHSELKLY